MQRKSGCEFFFFGKRVQFVYGKQRKRKNLFLRLKWFMRKDDEKIARARYMCSSFSSLFLLVAAAEGQVFRA